MATLPTLHPTSDELTGSWAAWSGTYTNIDDDPSSSASEADVASSDTSETDALAYYGLTTMPTDFGSMDSLQYRIRYRFQSLSNDIITLYAQIVQSDGTAALTDEMIVASASTTGSWTDSTDVLFAGVQGLDKSRWDGALLKIRTTYNKQAGPDNGYVEIAAVDLEGAYTPLLYPAYCEAAIAADDAKLMKQAAYAIKKAAYDITNEDPGTTNHAERLQWSRNVTLTEDGPVVWARKMIWRVLDNATIRAGIGAGTSTSSDNDVQSTVNSLVDEFALG